MQRNKNIILFFLFLLSALLLLLFFITTVLLLSDADEIKIDILSRKFCVCSSIHTNYFVAIITLLLYHLRVS